MLVLMSFPLLDDSQALASVLVSARGARAEHKGVFCDIMSDTPGESQIELGKFLKWVLHYTNGSITWEVRIIFQVSSSVHID